MHNATSTAQTRRARMSPMDVRPDGFLLPLIQQGDREALGELYDRYAVRLGRFIAPRTGGIYDADDVVQSAFRTFMTTADNGHYDLPDGRDLWGLLVAIAMNKLRSRTRYEMALKRSRVGGRIEAPAAEHEGNEVVDMQDALEQLPLEERELVVLRMAGCVVEEIARRVGRSKRTVERQLQSCRDMLTRLGVADA